MYRMQPFRRRRGLPLGQIVIAVILAAASLISYFGTQEDNPVTGESQHVNISVDQEIAMGLQAAPEMAAQFGGLDPDPNAQALVDQVGGRIVQRSAAQASPYQYEFHVLDDANTINAFALPGGQVFITRALLDRLQTEGQLAGVLGHEIGHVVGRHGAQQIAKAKLTEGLTGAVVIASYDPNDPYQRNSAFALLIGQLVNMKFGREDELESDFLGVCFIHEAGYDPNELVGVMQILEDSRQGQSPPEFFSTHPNPENRIAKIQNAIQNLDACP